MNEAWKDRIDEHGGAQNDQPCVRGAGVPVEAVIDALATGESLGGLLERFPALSAGDIQACLAYAVDALRRDRFVKRVMIGLAESRAGVGIPDEELDDFFGRNDE